MVVVAVVVVVKKTADTQPAGMPVKPQPRPVVVLCRMITIGGKYKTNILIIQTEVTICKPHSMAHTGSLYIRSSTKRPKKESETQNRKPQTGFPYNFFQKIDRGGHPEPENWVSDRKQTGPHRQNYKQKRAICFRTVTILNFFRKLFVRYDRYPYLCFRHK